MSCGQVLYSEDGYTYLDVRPALELEEIGKVKGCVNVPKMLAKRVYDPKENKKVVKKEENPDWLEQVTCTTACSEATAEALTLLHVELSRECHTMYVHCGMQKLGSLSTGSYHALALSFAVSYLSGAQSVYASRHSAVQTTSPLRSLRKRLERFVALLKDA